VPKKSIAYLTSNKEAVGLPLFNSGDDWLSKFKSLKLSVAEATKRTAQKPSNTNYVKIESIFIPILNLSKPVIIIYVC